MTFMMQHKGEDYTFSFNRHRRETRPPFAAERMGHSAVLHRKQKYDNLFVCFQTNSDIPLWELN